MIVNYKKGRNTDDTPESENYVSTIFNNLHSHPGVFYWGRLSWTLAPANSMQVSNTQSLRVFVSCRYYVEDTVIVQTIKNIKKGEEICENYGPIFFHSPKADRQVPGVVF